MYSYSKSSELLILKKITKEYGIYISGYDFEYINKNPFKFDGFCRSICIFYVNLNESKKTLPYTKYLIRRAF